MTSYKTTPQTKKHIESLWRLEKIILDTLNYDEVVQKICDSVIAELSTLNLGYEIVVLALKNPETKTIKRIAISHTKKAKEALKVSPIPFHKIIIPLNYNNNLLIQVIKEKKAKTTKYWPDILTPSFDKADALTIQKTLGIKASLVFPVFLKNKAIGAMIFSISKAPSQVSKDEYDLIKSFTDVVGLAVQNASLYSDLEKTTNQLEKANRNLRHLDKLKDEFVFIATHELKNPVTAMRGYLSMIKEGTFGKVPQKLNDPLDQLQISNQQLVQLVNDLLQIARTEAKTLTFNTTKVEIYPIVDAVIGNVKPLYEQKGLGVKHICPTKNLTVQADENKLKEIINNLVSNAIKYSEKGTITITHEVKDKKIVTHVKDQGYGIHKKDHDKIFTRFFRVEEEAAKGIPGTGLGLFIVKQLVEKMDGKIWFESTMGIGTTFSFSLPR